MRNVLLWLLGAMLPASLLAMGVVGPTFAQSVEAPTNLAVVSSKPTVERQPLDVTLTWEHSAVEVVFEIERGFLGQFQATSEVEFTPLLKIGYNLRTAVYSYLDLNVWGFASDDPPCYRVRALTGAGTSNWRIACEVRPPSVGGAEPTPVGTGIAADRDSFSQLAIFMTMATGAALVFAVLSFVAIRGE